MQTTYSIETMAAIIQEDRLAEARARRLARIASVGRQPGFFRTMVAAVRQTLSGPSEDLTFLPKLADYPVSR